MTHPIDRIEWRLASSLVANDYNPNSVARAELVLLEHNLVVLGWVQPILVTPDWTIIDGFHRWRLAQESPRLLKRDKGMVPVVVVDVGKDEAMALTIRMNRAKGEHAARPMHDIVRALMDEHGWTAEDVARELGASPSEVALLYKAGVFDHRDIASWTYSKAWYPDETGTDHFGRARQRREDVAGV